MGVKIGISYAQERPMTAPLPLCGDIIDAMKCAKAAGFDAIEIHGREFEFPPKQMEKIKDGLKKYNMEIAAIATGRLYNQTLISLTDPDDEKRAWSVEQTKKYVDVASELNTDIIIGWLRGRKAPEITTERYTELLTDSIKKLDKYAGLKRVKLVLEAINRYEVDSFITAAETLEFVNKNHLENTYLHLDTFHMNIEEANMCEAIKKTGKKLGYIHVADNTRLAPGTGSLDFQSIFRALNDIGYEGYATAECFPYPTGEATAEVAGKYLNKVREHLE